MTEALMSLVAITHLQGHVQVPLWVQLLQLVLKLKKKMHSLNMFLAREVETSSAGPFIGTKKQTDKRISSKKQTCRRKFEKRNRLKESKAPTYLDTI